MRLVLFPPRHLSHNRIAFAASCSRRQIYGSSRFRANDSSGVFPDNLQKTLDAHRAANRARLIRLVPSKSPPEEACRTETPAQINAAPEPFKATPSERPPSTPGQSPRKRKRSVSNKDATSTPQPAPSETPGWVTRQLWWGANSHQHRPPWLTYCLDNAKRSQPSAAAQLDAEIRALERYLTPTQREQSRVDQLVTLVTKQLEAFAPNPLQLIGSWQTGVASSHSDLQFLLPVQDKRRPMDSIRKPSATRPQVLDSYRELLRKVERTLRLNPMFSGQVHLANTRIPTLTTIHRSTGLRLRFHCGEGPPSSLEYIKDYLAEYPAVRPLYRATHLILEARGVFGALQSSIGSNALLMLLVAFSKMNHGRFQRPDSLGDQLLAFLQAYGVDIDLRTTGVAVDPPGWFNAETIRDESLRWPGEEIPAHLRGQRSLINLKRTAAVKRNQPIADHLCIQDPANYMNDLGRSCTRTQDLQRAWGGAHGRLRKALDAWDDSKDPATQSILTHGLRASFNDFDKKRAILACAPSVIY